MKTKLTKRMPEDTCSLEAVGGLAMAGSDLQALLFWEKGLGVCQTYPRFPKNRDLRSTSPNNPYLTTGCQLSSDSRFKLAYLIGVKCRKKRKG